MAARYAFEDFHVGLVIPLGPTQPITAEEIVAFATQFDPQPFHVDPEAGKRSIYGSLIASGWHTISLMMRLNCDAYLLDAKSAGSPGIDELRWLKPLRPGDSIRGEFEVTEIKPSTSKPDRGIVKSQWRAYNQHGELIATMKGMGLFLRRDA